jgi:hypothetical protein
MSRNKLQENDEYIYDKKFKMLLKDLKEDFSKWKCVLLSKVGLIILGFSLLSVYLKI